MIVTIIKFKLTVYLARFIKIEYIYKFFWHLHMLISDYINAYIKFNYKIYFVF